MHSYMNNRGKEYNIEKRKLMPLKLQAVRRHRYEFINKLATGGGFVLPLIKMDLCDFESRPQLGIWIQLFF